ncbi:HD domain-containing protein [Desulfovibrio subterraneus]|uniref:HD family phosphohydrolase n=1 Tax=Desulfovibrio subterraneus TaxID=2718620 RepID=A0A7J0BJR8_9BACT|nr:HD domain-containing protein [Desulfovibrio subterraneus]GFM33422.1 HD family phosphohydrolase [Desulfovibrio subterraneus]
MTPLPDIAAHEAWFEAWTAGYLTDDEQDNRYIELKRNHTMRVLENARRIVGTLDMPEHVARTALLAALYHDVGRFPQYAQYRTFSDQRSVNHGILGCKTLRRLGVLNGGSRNEAALCESRSTQANVLASVAMHNRFRVPSGISSALRAVTDVVRDSDKIDIFPVMIATFTRDGSENDVVTLHLEEKEGAWSPGILESLRERRLASYKDMRYVNDFKLLLGSWVFELNYAESRLMLRERGLVEALLATWPEHPDVVAMKDVVREALMRD